MTEDNRPVLVAYDASPSAETALDWAAENIAATTDLRVVLVASETEPVTSRHQHVARTAVEKWRTAASDRLATLGRADSSIDVRHGPVVPQLLEAAEKASMLVVGSSGHSLVVGTLTGSVSQHLARSAPCPVVVVRPCHSTAAERIVVGVDDSSASVRALRLACEKARRSGGTVTAIHGFTPADRQLADAEMMVRDAVRDCAAEFADVPIDLAAVPARAAHALVDASRTASLVVVGSRGRDAFTEMALGSVSQHVLHHAECPVAIVR